jgi:hypothetical protein
LGEERAADEGEAYRAIEMEIYEAREEAGEGEGDGEGEGEGYS